MNALDLISWLRWADEAETEQEKEARAQRIQRHLFPPELSEDERKRRVATLEHVKKMGEPPSWEGWPEACPLPDTPQPALAITVPRAAPLQWEGLISPSSKAYKRGSKHDGTQAEVEKMRGESQGSPFDANPDDVRATDEKVATRSRVLVLAANLVE